MKSEIARPRCVRRVFLSKHLVNVKHKIQKEMQAFVKLLSRTPLEDNGCPRERKHF